MDVMGRPRGSYDDDNDDDVDDDDDDYDDNDDDGQLLYNKQVRSDRCRFSI